MRGVGVLSRVVLYGNDHDEMKKIMLRALSPYKKIAYFRNHTPAGQYGCGEDTITLLDFTCPFAMNNEACIFVFKRGAVSFGGIKLPSTYVPVLGEENAGAVPMLTHTGCPVVTCGMSPRDTLSLSSSDFPSALVSIQRDIRTLSGNVMEPADFRVHLSAPSDEYPLLAACAALLLLDTNPEKGFCI